MRLAFLSFIVAVGALQAAPALAQSEFNLPEGPGRNLVYGQCQTCHDLQNPVESAGIPRSAWNAVLDNMKEYGLRITPEQRAKILDYLATYLGPNPPPAAKAAPAPAGNEEVDGAQQFSDVCAACHEPDAKGKKGKFPALAGNKDLFLSKDFPIKVVLNGLEGTIEVEGDKIKGQMPSFDFLTDDEIAAAVNYVRSHFGNDKLAPAGFTEITPADVAAVRGNPMSSKDVYALRQKLLK